MLFLCTINAVHYAVRPVLDDKVVTLIATSLFNLNHALFGQTFVDSCLSHPYVLVEYPILDLDCYNNLHLSGKAFH